MSVGDPPKRVSITPANLAVPKNGHARAIRFATSAALREAHDCRTGDLRRSVTEE
jgi:putative transcriptional regulator